MADDPTPEFRDGLWQDVKHAHRAKHAQANDSGSGCLPIAVLLIAAAVIYVAAVYAQIGVLL